MSRGRHLAAAVVADGLLTPISAAGQHAPASSARPRVEIMPLVGFRVGAPYRGTVRWSEFVGSRFEVVHPGGEFLGSQVRVRLVGPIGIIATAATSSWHARTNRLALRKPPVANGVEVETENGGFTLLSAGLDVDVRRRGLAPLSLMVGPGLLEERYPSRPAVYEMFEDPVRHRMLVTGVEARFPIRHSRLAVQIGLRDQIVWWNRREYERRFESFERLAGGPGSIDVLSDHATAHIATGHLALSLGL